MYEGIINEKSPEEIQVPECEENNEISICLLLSKYGTDMKILSTKYLNIM